MIQSSSYIAIPPGATIKEQLNTIGMTQKEFSERMGYSEKHISKLINGSVSLTYDVSLKLEAVLGLPASFWNNLENAYREQLILVEDENKMEEEKEIAKHLPYADGANLGWFPKTRKLDEKVRYFRSFFRVSDLSILKNSDNLSIVYRRLSNNDNAQNASIMWVQHLKNVADQMDSDKINVDGLSKILDKIREMTREDPNDFFPNLRQILASFGVKLIVTPSLRSSQVHGASFIHHNSIVLGLTDRRRDADIFWFSLFHEIGHIVSGHIYNDGQENKEVEADAFAKNILIPEAMFTEFVDKKEFNKISITEFADKIGIDKGIVVGRLQKEGHLGYSQYNDLKTRYQVISTDD